MEKVEEYLKINKIEHFNSYDCIVVKKNDGECLKISKKNGNYKCILISKNYEEVKDIIKNLCK